MQFKSAFPDALSLETEKVQLRLLTSTDFDSFHKISHTKSIWTYFTKDLSIEAELRQWVADALADKEAGRRYPFAIVEKETGKVCGSTSLGSISFYDRRIEIGWSWLGEEFMGTGFNKHAKFLLLQYAFEHVGIIRVEIKTDNLNERAKKALAKIGATPEGVLRSHMQMFNNRRRDSIYYSILNNEWPQIKESIFKGIQ
ncbi:GNAT family N-acetyltransferase [Chryseosolibacter indicus]|uniref:GNAT family N-acetyltransferase n=1 Tax=Chryseosolibacter indicus TaxID=2782351 RepID=A0ABS5VS94_9BACT|nr:GNAT family protein [Chryseosolibacter indicus]MBT1704307.1 GNAT family N-acetyltransferase [Chryseosolibacter indicus]